MISQLVEVTPTLVICFGVLGMILFHMIVCCVELVRREMKGNAK